MNEKDWLCALHLSEPGRAPDPPAPATPTAPRTSGATQRRLAKAFACLEDIRRRQACGQASLLDTLREKWIIWRELLALERQGVVERTRELAGGRRRG